LKVDVEIKSSALIVLVGGIEASGTSEFALSLALSQAEPEAETT